MATASRQQKQVKQPLFSQPIAMGAVAAIAVLFLILVSGGAGDLPDFEANTLSGETVKLSDYRGQVVMLNFWATWCPPCKAEMPDIEGVYRKYQDRGFTVLAINNGEPPSLIQPFVNTLGLSFPVVLDSNTRLQRAFGITGYPTSMFISPEGELYATHSGMITEALLEHYVTTGLKQ